MAYDRERQPVGALINTAARGLCMDCGREFAGELGVRLVVSRGVVGVEVFICTDKEMHSLGRVEMHNLPFVRLDDVNPRTAT